MKSPLALCLLLLSAAPALADVALAPLFTDHAVLQRERDVPVWGTARPGEVVHVAFADQTRSVTAGEDGRWSVTLAPLSANATGAELIVRGDNVITLRDVVVGEVWLCGGQSNMEWPLRMTLGAESDIAAADLPLIRHFKVANRIARDPITSANGDWQVCSPANAPHFTAVGFHFARRVAAELGVPVGLVNSTWGGTPVEAWLPPSTFSNAAVRADAASHQAVAYARFARDLADWRDRTAAWREARTAARTSGQPFDAVEPTAPWTPGAENHSLVLYNGMIEPLVPYALRGFLWYQGEANADQPSTYEALFTTLIGAWREKFAAPSAPFLWVQLANWAPGGNPDGTDWAFLREAQTRTLAVPDTGQAVIIDIGDSVDIHPRNKRDVGERLARLALNRTYGRPTPDTGPTLAAAQFEDANVRVTFSDADGLRTTDGDAPRGFELAGADGQFHPAEATLDGARVTLRATAVTEPRYVRYAWRNDPGVNLINAHGLPAAPFRTDRLPGS